jgi:hypothetical protein
VWVAPDKPNRLSGAEHMTHMELLRWPQSAQ